MAISIHIRLEPRPYQRDLQAGFASAVHDPVWFLARQWQMGEHQGENASSPTWVDYGLRSRSIRAADPRFDPTIIPAETIVESEIDDWWTMGRRVRIGRRFAGDPVIANDPKLPLVDPPPPYERFAGDLDGLLVWRDRARLGLPDAAFGPDVPPDSTPAWDTAHLLYEQDESTAFQTDQERLVVRRHRGGRMDWHSVDATAAVEPEPSEPDELAAIPTVLVYPGAPSLRWWQIEDAAVDMGGYPPDQAHTATAMLTELIFSHSDDWFLFPIVGQAGRVVTIDWMDVTDSFGRTYASRALDDIGQPRWPGLLPPDDWTLFKVDGATTDDEGLGTGELVLWHVAELPLESTPLERVQFGLDEESNLVWAVERTIAGREAESREIDLPAGRRFNDGRPSGDARKSREYAYVPAQGIAPYWHPYVFDDEAAAGTRRLVQRSLADLSRQRPTRMPMPRAEVLQSVPPGPRHQIAPLAIPASGVEVERRWMLARDMAGQPVLWIQRQRRSLLSPPARRLRFDVMEEANEPPPD